MGKLGERGEGIWKKKSFAGKLGTENEKAIDSIANVNASFFSLKIDGVRWTGYPHPNNNIGVWCLNAKIFAVTQQHYSRRDGGYRQCH